MSASLPARSADIAGNRFAKVLILLLREQCACQGWSVAMSFFAGAATNAAISFRHKEFLRI